jgi:itaconate CoA-transferase
MSALCGWRTDHAAANEWRYPMSGPLDGVTVVAIEQAVSGPLATRHLADLGARVIKIERIDGGDFARDYDDAVNGLASHFVWLNRGKESLTVDFRDAQGRAIVDDLLASADVFLENMGTEAAKRAGLHPDQLIASYPELVSCEISGYGAGGAYEGKPAYDLIIQAEAGSIAVTGRPGALAKPGIAIADIGAGMYAFSSILAALLEKRTTGQGRAIAISMFDTVVEWMGYSMYNVGYSGREQTPFGIGTQAITPYGAYTTADGRQIVAGVQNEREWSRLCLEVIDRPDLLEDEALVTNSGRLERREELDAACSAAFATMTLDDAQLKLDRARIANGVVRPVSEVLTHPQLVTRDRHQTVGTPNGPITATLPVPVVDGWTMRMGDIPALGEHTDAILAELGRSPAQVRELRDASIVGGA